MELTVLLLDRAEQEGRIAIKVATEEILCLVVIIMLLVAVVEELVADHIVTDAMEEITKRMAGVVVVQAE
jgi:hypothetical protein